MLIEFEQRKASAFNHLQTIVDVKFDHNMKENFSKENDCLA